MSTSNAQNENAKAQYGTSREARHEWADKALPVDMSMPSNAFKISAGKYGTPEGKIEVHEDGNWTVSSRTYPDDVLAFIAGSLKNKPGVNPDIIWHLKKVVQLMDEAAVNAHGYGASPQEKDYDWKPLV